jgi:excisionase family DNA binding protein
MILNVNELSDQLKISKSMIYQMTSKREIPYVKLGSRVVFETSEIEKWIKSKSFDAVPQ